MALDLNTALQQLATLTQGTYTKEDLATLARQVSAEASGNVTVLYSGMVNGVSSSSIAEGMASDPNIRIINNTVVAKFLNSNAFRSALGATEGISNADMLDEAFTSPAKTALNNWLFGSNPTTSPWADASKRFVTATSGEVRILTEIPDATRTLYQVEIPELINRLNAGAITKIDGLTSIDLLQLGTGDALKNTIFNNAGTQTIFSKPTSASYSDFINATPETLKVHMASATPNDLAKWHLNLSTFQVPHSASRILNKLGPLGALLGFGFATANASAAEANGDHEAAQQIMIDYGVDTAGSAAGEVIAGAIAGLGAAALVAGGVLTAPVAGAIVIGAALLGGFFGGDAAKELYQSLKDRDDNGRSDFLDKLGNLVFGADYTITTSLPPELVGKTALLDATFSREQIVELAKQDIAWRYALRELNPFAITGISYNQFNADKSLDLYDPETDEGTMTDLYLADRAAMLTWKIRFDTGALDENDTPHTGVKPYNQDWDTSSVNGNWDFVDLSTKLAGGAPLTLAIDGVGITQYDHQIVFGTKNADTIEGSGDFDHLYGMGGNDEVSGGDGNDYIEGNAGQDTLKGEAGNDILIGGTEVDILDGGEGNDQLKGGAGVDVYQFNGNYGMDIITDSDGQGFISIDNNPANSGTYKLDNIYKNEGTGYTFTKVNGGNSVIISKEGDANRIIINDWSTSKNLSIDLTGSAPAAPAATLTGDFKKKIDDHGTADTSDDTFVISNGNYVRDTTNGSGDELGALDLITGTSGNDVIDGGGGSDALFGLGGDDYIIGGTEGDVLEGGLGADTLLGGDGDDKIYGSSNGGTIYPTDANYVSPLNNNDFQQGSGFNWTSGYNSGSQFGNGTPSGLLANAIARDRQLGDAGNLIDGGAGNDFIAAGTGADYVHGGADKDLIYGMDGNDILFGDDGNDVVYGDGPAFQAGIVNWVADFGDDIIDGGIGEDFLIGGGGNDIVFGGEGNDKIWGDDADQPLLTGDDFLYGGNGNDSLYGGNGNDYLDGGSEDDHLFGGDGNDTLTGGAGADTLNGGDGADVIYWNLKEGDRLENTDSQDTVIADVTSDEIVDMTYASNNDSTVTFVLKNGTTSQAGSGVSGKSDFTYTFADGSHVLHSDLVGSRLSTQIAISSTDSALFGGKLNDTLVALGNSNSTLFGGQGNDTLTGGGGNDTLDGGAGNDILIGGAGDDTYVINDIGDVLMENPDNGIDTVNSSVTYTLASGIEILNLTGADAIDGSGNELNNTITGNSAGNRLSGDVGSDTLWGGDGNDTLVGGIDNDKLYGGQGNDTYTFSLGDGQDVIDDTQGINTISFGQGIAREDVQLTQYQANDGHYYLRISYGNSGDGVVIKDGLTGNIQNYQFADGTNVSWADLVGTSGVPLEVRGTEAADNLYGTSQDDVFYANDGNDHAYGLDGNDIMDGQDGNDILEGGNGDDFIDGGIGDDTLIGGAGIDAYFMYWGMGKDVAIDGNGADNSYLALASGMSIYDLETVRDGNDLYLNIRGTQDGMVLKDYYAGNQQWTIADNQGNETTVSDLLAIDGTSSVQREQNLYQSLAKATFYNIFTRDGYTVNSNGTLSKTNISSSSNSLIVSNKTAQLTYISQDSNDTIIYRTPDAWVNSSYSTQKLTQVFDYSGESSGTQLMGEGIMPPIFIPDNPNGTKNVAIDGNSVGLIKVEGGYWLYPSSAFTNVPVIHSPTFHTIFTERHTYEHSTASIENIVAGDGNNTIKFAQYYSWNSYYINSVGTDINLITVDAGAGNDIIDGNLGGGRQAVVGPNDPTNIGAFLYGNTGNDTIVGSFRNDTLIGGEGSDVMDGGNGSDIYIVYANDTGIDEINDKGAPILFYESIFTSFDIAYYNSIGIPISGPFDTRFTHQNLPPLPSYIAANDYAKLAPLFATNVLDKDTVQFGAGINLSDLTITYKISGALNAGIPSSDLLVTWENDKGVRINLPRDASWADPNIVNASNVDWNLGVGIEQFKFADGSVISMADMLKRANYDTDTTLNFRRGMGQQVLGSSQNIVLFSNNIDPGLLTLTRNGNALTIATIDGSDSLTISNAYASSNSYGLNLGIQFYQIDCNGNATPKTQATMNGVVTQLDVNQLKQYYELKFAPVFAHGVGHQTIDAGSPVVFANDIDPGTLKVTNDGNSLIISSQDGSDSFTLTNVYVSADSYNAITNTIRFFQVGTNGGYSSQIMANFGSGVNAYFSSEMLQILAGNGKYIVGTVDADIITVANNTLGIYGDAGNDFIDAQNNQTGIEIDGGDGNDTVLGSASNDRLIGGSGDDVLMGGAGNDTYTFYAQNQSIGHDVINEQANDVNSTDTIELNGVSPISLVLQKQQNNLILVSGADSVTIKDWYLPDSNTIEQVRFVYDVYDANGNYNGQTTETWDKATIIAHAPSANHAPEMATLIAAQDATQDTAFSYQIPADAFADADAGDSLTYSVKLANGDNLPDWLSFDANTRTLSGTPLNGNVGNFALQVTVTDLAGLSASQTFSVNVANVNDAPIAIGTIADQQATDGSAFIWTIPAGLFTDVDANDQLSYTITRQDGSALPSWLSFNATTGKLTGTPTLTDIGVPLNLKVTATDLAGATAATALNLNVNAMLDRILTGTAGNDTLTGGSGNDTLDGLAGVDRMVGSYGNDTYYVDRTTDVVVELTDQGIDTVKSTVNLTTLAANVENLELLGTATTGAGNELNNTLIGNTANNTLDGKAGADTMVGGLGNDTYTVDDASDQVIELAGEGTDKVNASISYTLSDNIENLTLTGTANINGSGNTLANTITGNSGNNTLYGFAGADNINGGAGADTMLGGADNDTYTVDDAGDQVIELVGEGTDKANASVTYTLSDNVENLTLTGTTNIGGSGNALANTLTGNTGNNTLYGLAGADIINGGAGADTMIGGADNDTYTVDDVGDQVIELAGEGTDKVNSSIDYTLSDNVENLTLTGTANLNGIGNALANAIAGNTGHNYLYGLAGADTLTGGIGNDVLQGGSDNDTLNSNAGQDLLDGGSGNDKLNGGTENDLLIGGTGNDTITADLGNDVILFNKGDGQDTIAASVGTDNTLSLGGNFAYSDLSLTKSGNNLILKMGATDQITFSGWYATTANQKSVLNLQVIAEAMQGFTLGGTDNLRNNKVENFNFQNLVAAFDAAGATANWQLTDARLTTHLLAGSDSAAIGGDIAYQYGKNSNLTGIGLIATQNVINNASLGTTAQTLNNPTTWQTEAVKLA